MPYLAVLPLPVLLGIIVLAHRKYSLEWRESIITGSLVFSLAVVAVSEILSLLHLLEFAAVCGFWSAAAFVSVIYLAKKPADYRSFITAGKSITGCERYFLLFLLLVVIFTGFLAVYCPANNFDAMTYHLSRVEHWVQNHTLMHYQTANIRQLYSGPLAEIMVMHSRILSGSDMFANMIQWLAFNGILIAASLLAARFDMSRSAQWLSALFCLTLPMAVLQASSAQNDLVVAFFLLIFAVFFVDWYCGEKRRDLVFMGLSLGIAILAKGTAYIFALPLALLAVVKIWRCLRSKFVPVLAIFALLILLPNLGQYSRNYIYCGLPMGAQEGIREDFSLNNTISNAVKFLATSMNTPFVFINDQIEFVVRFLHLAAGLEPDIKKAHYGSIPFYLPLMPFHEDIAGNPLHLLIILAALLIVMPGNGPVRVGSPALKTYLSALLLAGILLVMLVQWQPWLTRIIMPLLLMASPWRAIHLIDSRAACYCSLRHY
jgi:4-amino-4-deoxy-L-arabinose transferase-like glycosyltransferase